MKSSMPILDVNTLTKYFGGLGALVDLDLEVFEGEIVGLIGPNGAGKSTVFNLISGFLSPTRGRVIFKGKDITRLSPHLVVKRGIARIFQGDILFQNFTVLTNVVLGLHLQANIGYWGSFLGIPSAREREKVLRQKAMEVLKFVGLSEKANEIATNLPHGYQRRLSIAIAIAAEPALLLLDEPVTGMNAEEMAGMIFTIRQLRERRGITIIIVEHNMKAVMGLCDRIAVLNFGKKILEGSPKEVAENPAVIEAYLGQEEYATGS